MQKDVVTKKMEELVGYFERLEQARKMLSELELDTRYVGLEKYAEPLWKAEKRLDKVIHDMAIDITVAQIRIDRLKNN